MTEKRSLEWKRYAWGWNLDGLPVWSAQIYQDGPDDLLWRVFGPNSLVLAEGPATTLAVAQVSAQAVLDALTEVHK